jgi:periplasmic copper chaperone A
MRATLLAAIAAIGLAGSALAQATTIDVSDAWARATTSSARAGGVYLTMKAIGGSDRVVSASSPVAERVELHETIRDGNVMRMRQVPELRIQPTEPTVLQPGGLHIMLIGLKQQLNRGDSFPLTITFEKAPAVTVTVTVRAPGAGGHSHRH